MTNQEQHSETNENQVDFVLIAVIIVVVSCVVVIIVAVIWFIKVKKVPDETNKRIIELSQVVNASNELKPDQNDSSDINMKIQNDSLNHQYPTPKTIDLDVHNDKNSDIIDDSEFEGDDYKIVKDDIDAETIKINNWLIQKCALPQYLNNFLLNGYDSLDIIGKIENRKYLQEIGIELPGHQMKIFSEIKELNKVIQNTKGLMITEGNFTGTTPVNDTDDDNEEKKVDGENMDPDVYQGNEYNWIENSLKMCDDKEWERYLYNFKKQKITDKRIDHIINQDLNGSVWKDLIPEVGVRMEFGILLREKYNKS